MLKKTLIKLHWIISDQFGFDIRRLFRSLLGLPRFARDWRKFRRQYDGPLTLVPCLHDWSEEGGATKNEYFWQDLLVARWIFEARPLRHVDVGSRVDGFVAHVASFREIEVFDVRPISTQIENITFVQADLMNSVGLPAAEGGYCDSLSCLHALEHFGLGRYGDVIDAAGYQRGLANMSSLIRSGGVFYLSVPVGRERVEFNANRVFDPRNIVSLGEVNGLVLRGLTMVGRDGSAKEMSMSKDVLKELAEADYGLGIFVFAKS